MSTNEITTGPQALREQANALLQQAAEAEAKAREAEREAMRKQEEEAEIAAIIQKVTMFGPEIRAIADAIEKVLGVGPDLKSCERMDPRVAEAIRNHGALSYTFSYGRMRFELVHNPTVFRGSIWHGRHESIGVAGVTVTGYHDRKRVNKTYRTNSFDGAAKKFADKVAVDKELEDAHSKLIQEKNSGKTAMVNAIREAIRIANGGSESLVVEVSPVMREADPYRHRGGYVETGAFTVTVAHKATDGGCPVPIQTYCDVRVGSDGSVLGTVSARVNVRDHFFGIVKTEA